MKILQVTIAGLLVALAAIWFFSEPVSEEDAKLEIECHERAVSMELGVYRDERTARFHYHMDPVQQRLYLSWMFACLPEGHPERWRYEMQLRKNKG